MGILRDAWGARASAVAVVEIEAITTTAAMPGIWVINAYGLSCIVEYAPCLMVLALHVWLNRRGGQRTSDPELADSETIEFGCAKSKGWMSGPSSASGSTVSPANSASGAVVNTASIIIGR